MPKDAEPGSEALVYDPSRVSWAVAEAVSTPPSSLARSALYMIVFLIAGAIVYAQLTSITITVEGPGTIRTSAKIIPVKAEAAGRLKVFSVTENQPVKKGQVIAELDGQVDATTLAAARDIGKRLDALNELAGAAKPNLDKASADAGRLSGEIMRLDIQSLVRERAQLAEAANALNKALRGVRDVPALSAADAGERDADMVKLAKIKRQRLQQDLSQEIADLERSIARSNVAIRNRRDQAGQELSSARAALAVQLRSFEQSLDAHMKTMRVLAPADGIASKVTVSGPTELVTANQTLLDIIPDGSSLIAELRVANKDIAELKVGMPVQLRLDAMPYQDWGTLPGRIIEIPPDATTTDNNPQSQPVYLVKVALDATSLDAGNGPRPVILGMTLQAEVQLRKRTLLDMAIRQILQLKEF
jgi:multidrug efflux pump subunit AcrA (membrane-fusion protein)